MGEFRSEIAPSQLPREVSEHPLAKEYIFPLTITRSSPSMLLKGAIGSRHFTMYFVPNLKGGFSRWPVWTTFVGNQAASESWVYRPHEGCHIDREAMKKLLESSDSN